MEPQSIPDECRSPYGRFLEQHEQDAQVAPIEQPNGFTQRDEANAVTVYAFRNTFLEEIHIGIPAGFSNQEMKKLMIQTSARLAALLYLKETQPDLYAEFLADYVERFCRDPVRPWERVATDFELPEPPRRPCQRCGKDVRIYWSFCPSCGALQKR